MASRKKPRLIFVRNANEVTAYWGKQDIGLIIGSTPTTRLTEQEIRHWMQTIACAVHTVQVRKEVERVR